ncbi:hypothetical protein KC660_03655 [Candidatus Dojkabacteria bacterium]|uniref:Uncharacterized protein n=1 Tax=Candidatus Dojkabacteria bacterium TaxID=2099670 RepID=A0A955L427_9BACT|nr:hypothetical protein [Candidatus Dojkabacteria bacterium]
MKVFIIIGLITLVSLISVSFVGFLKNTNVKPLDDYDAEKYSKGKSDIDLIASAMNQMVKNDLDNKIPLIESWCLKGATLPEIPSLTLNSTEGGTMPDLADCMGGYLGDIPLPPAGYAYKWGVDNSEEPTVLRVGFTVTNVQAELSNPDYVVTVFTN